MRKKLTNLDEYNPVIYPRKLWVAKSLEDLDEYFTFLSMDGNNEPVPFDKVLGHFEADSGIMFVTRVLRNSDGALGVLVVIVDLDGVSADVIPHEAVHVADYYYEELGMYTQDFRDGNEAYAYLVGWAGGCISKTVSELKAEEYNNKIESHD